MDLIVETNLDSQKRESGHSIHYQRLSKKYQKILDTIEKSPNPITPLEISSLTEINSGTVRKYVRNLEKWGFIWGIFYGHYKSSKNLFTLGRSEVKSDCPRIHCLRLRVIDSSKIFRTFSLDLVFLKVTFQHHNNGSISVFVDCVGSYSLDYVSFRLLVELVMKELDLDDWEKVTVLSFELNNDFKGGKIDGAKAVTLRTFDGSFRRVYQKRFGVRDEVKVVGGIQVRDVLTLLNGGVEAYNFSRLLFTLIEEVRLERKAVKFQSQLVMSAVSSMKKWIEALETRTEITTSIEKTCIKTETTNVVHNE